MSKVVDGWIQSRPGYRILGKWRTVLKGAAQHPMAVCFSPNPGVNAGNIIRENSRFVKHNTEKNNVLGDTVVSAIRAESHRHKHIGI